jgi:uncharacterized glyoxalase superfamily protein PhnB
MTTSTDTSERNAMTTTSLIPVLVYEDIEAAHDYLVASFGFASGGLYRDGDGDGSVVHAEVRAGECAIWLHRVTAEHEMASPKGSPASHGGLEVIVPDVDAHYQHARSSGALIDREPTDQDYGLREYGARDPEGHRWWFASSLAG